MYMYLLEGRIQRVRKRNIVKERETERETERERGRETERERER
jgi:hypothetical protein